ncbi:MAG: hypothetical protein ACRDQB_12830 [Thermocrispum sp.]
MMTAIAFIVILTALGYLAYLAQRNHAKQPFHPRMAGSVPFEDRDIARISHDLQR